MKTPCVSGNMLHFFHRHNKQTIGIFLLFISCASLVSFSRKEHHNKQNTATNDERTSLVWKLDATIGNVSFYHAISECDGKKIAFLRFVNKNNSTLKISWKETVKTQFKEENSFRGEQHLELPPGETFESNCSASTCKACLILPDQVNPAYVAEIEDFSFKNISVSK